MSASDGGGWLGLSCFGQDDDDDGDDDGMSRVVWGVGCFLFALRALCFVCLFAGRAERQRGKTEA